MGSIVTSDRCSQRGIDRGFCSPAVAEAAAPRFGSAAEFSVIWRDVGSMSMALQARWDMPRFVLALAVVAVVPLWARAQTLRSLAERKDLRIGAMALDGGWETLEQRALVRSELNAVTVGVYWVRTRPARDRYDAGRMARGARSLERNPLRLIPLCSFRADSDELPRVMCRDISCLSCSANSGSSSECASAERWR